MKTSRTSLAERTAAASAASSGPMSSFFAAEMREPKSAGGKRLRIEAASRR